MNIRARIWLPLFDRMIYTCDPKFKSKIELDFDSEKEVFCLKSYDEMIDYMMELEPNKKHEFTKFKSIQMLWTRKEDICGVDIYDEDIVITSTGRICKIIWFDSPKYVGWDYISLNDKGIAPEDWNDFKVIGNKYENNTNLKC